MVEQAPPWPKQGPASYFPSIEKKYGRSIGEWQQIIAGCGLNKHMTIVGFLKSEYGMCGRSPYCSGFALTLLLSLAWCLSYLMLLFIASVTCRAFCSAGSWARS